MKWSRGVDNVKCKGGRMKEELLKIINCYGVIPQLKYFQSEVFELNEAIIKYETLKDYYFKNTNFLREHITEEIADVLVMLRQFQFYYEVSDEEIERVMKFKINRQLERMKDDTKTSIGNIN